MLLDLLQGLLWLSLIFTSLLLPFIIAVAYHKYRAVIPFSIPVEYRRIIKIAAFVLPLCGWCIASNYPQPPVVLNTIGYLANALCLSIIVHRVQIITSDKIGYTVVILFYYVTNLAWLTGYLDV